MLLFPVGLISASSSQGTIDSVSYSMFEPNKSCKSVPMFSILTTKFDQKTMLVRKKNEPYLIINYEYDNIYQREYNQIDHFIHSSIDGGNTSFHVVDFSQGMQPSSITINSGKWVAGVSNTRLFSSTSNRKSSKAFFWTGTDIGTWKEGDISSMTTNASISVNTSANNYGSLTATDANTTAFIYPMYEVYAADNLSAGFSPTVFIDIKQHGVVAGGWMQSGTVSFTSRYKV